MSVYKRKSGRWAVLIDLDAGALGKRRRRSVGTYATRKDAERAERAALSQRDLGVEVSPRTVTVENLLARYLKDAAPRLERATVARYRTLIAKLIVPHLGDKTLARMRPAHIAEWIATLRERGGHKGKPLRAKTCRHAFVLLNGAWRWGIRMQLASTNPLMSVAAPTVPRSNARALSVEDIARVLSTAGATRWGALVSFAFATGMRRGEMCALSWSDIDLDRGTVLVAHSLTETRDGAVLKSTKTDRARTVPLSRVAIEALRRQRATQAADRLAAGPGYQVELNGPVFTDELGRRIQPIHATKAYARIARTAGIASLRLHDVRHTAATHLLVAGVDVRSVSGILGHASATTTLSTYAHLIADAQQDAVEKLGDRLERITGGNRMATAGARAAQKTP